MLDAYLDGELGGTLKLEFEAHVVECKTCGHMLGMMDAVGQIVAAPGPDEPRLSADFTDRVMADWAGQKRNLRWWYRMTRDAAAASVVLALGSAMIMWNRTEESPVESGRLTQIATHSGVASSANSQNLNTYLAGTFEKVESGLWELNEFRSTAVDQVRQGLFNLAGPAPIPVNNPVRAKPAPKARPSAGPTDPGLELL